jgi:hypothetical protein
MHAAPVQDEIKRLARDVYQDVTKKVREMIMEWFSQRRLSQLLQKELKRKASLNAAKSGAVAVEATVVRIVDACAGKDVAVRTMAGLYRRSNDLQMDIGTVSTSGSKGDVVRRPATCASTSLPLKSLTRRPCSRRFRRRTCACAQLTAWAAKRLRNNSLVECVAQYNGAHNHMRFVGIDYMPVSWLCAPCIAIPVYMICHIIGKRMLRNRTESHLG